MFVIIGLIIVFGSVVGAYSVHGSLTVLWQPLEFVIIFGALFGAFIVGSTKTTLVGTLKTFGVALKGASYKKIDYLELLGVLYSVFRLAKTKGDLALEAHVEKPEESTLFANFPTFKSNHHAVEFLCDYLRLLTLGASNSHEIEAVMDRDLEIHHEEEHVLTNNIQMMADGAPAMGIVAAVLGVILTMGSITEPPEILGKLIGAALVGTFAGILGSYGLFAPVAAAVRLAQATDAAYMTCIKSAIIGHMQGYAPQISIEFARKQIGSELRPTFAEVEAMIQTVPTPS
ncbi:MAG: flagellar motor stator protein MotA [Alphaproteobacteria bacterium]|nr:flagellar motor stator protein MotA [Alphaproteobacteria bacterium]